MKFVFMNVCAALMLLCCACTNQDGPLEKAGKGLDEAVENVKDGELPLHKKGPGEKAGEAVDRAVDKVKDR